MKNFEKIIGEIEKIISRITHCSENLNIDSRLREYGVTSLNFMKIVIQIENSFDFQFRDEDINFDKMGTIRKIAELVIKYGGKKAINV